MKNVLIILAVIAIIACKVYFSKNRKKLSGSDSEDFRNRIRPYCSNYEFTEFFNYLKNRGKFIGPEKGRLKGIFYRLIVPNSNISLPEKEEFRRFLIKIGVRDMESRPDYEIRDARLSKKTDAEKFSRKEAGNKGEQVIRDILKSLDPNKFSVVNGPALKLNDIIHEFDHIVVGDTGLFVIETKAFGMSDGHSCKAGLFIDPGDKWVLRKNQSNRNLESPTAQVLEEKSHIEIILELPYIQVRPVLVLSNTEIFVKQNIDLPYSVVKASELKKFIISGKDELTAQDKRNILYSLNQNRIN